MNGAKLVKMSNDFATFFAAEPVRRDALAGIAGHLQKFWDPRMRRQILDTALRSGTMGTGAT